MAEAKYLLAIDEMVRSGLMSDKSHARRAGDAVGRLEASAVVNEERVRAWGLGFAHGEGTAEEPYVVTTAFAAQALLSIDRRGHTPHARVVLEATLRWLDERVPLQRKALSAGHTQVPQYSPHTAAVITNSVALWAAGVALREGRRSDIAGPLEWIDTQYVAGAGWPYAPEHPRVDLVHQCYILNALGSISGYGAVEGRALECLSPFLQFGELIDKFDILPMEEAVATAAMSRSSLLHVRDEIGLVLYADAARPWGVGEFFLLCSFLERAGRHPQYWRAVGRRWAAHYLDHFDGVEMVQRWGLRQTMHVAHGLAAMLSNVRGRRT